VARALRERPPGRVVVNIDPHTSIFYARRTLELAVAWLYKFNRNLRLSYQL
jgi:type I restriction enzyme R subunit